jgi:peptidoglycan/xylan/chitin deacetylase (PgdA/CDA1 family)
LACRQVLAATPATIAEHGAANMSRRSFSGRAFLINLIRTSGLIGVIRLAQRHAVTILMLHGIMDQEVASSWCPLRPQLSRRRFQACLETLSRYYQFISLADAVDMIDGRIPLKPHSLVLTFDDGYRNQLKHALPILEAFNAPAAFFLCTGHIDNRKPFWFDRLDYALQQAKVAGRSFKIGGGVVEIVSENREDLAASFKRLRDSGKKIARPDREMTAEMESFAEELENESGKKLEDIFETDEWSALLSWQEITEKSSHPLVSFGSHTVDHTRLGCAGKSEITYQVIASKEKIEQHTGKECRFFCYPSGSFSIASLQVLKECGYTAAVTTLEGLNKRNDNPFTLRRINAPANGEVTDLLWQTFQLSGQGSVLGWNPKRAMVSEHRLGD